MSFCTYNESMHWNVNKAYDISNPPSYLLYLFFLLLIILFVGRFRYISAAISFFCVICWLELIMPE